MSIQKKLIVLIALAASGLALAQPGSGPGMPYELLATAPGITKAQQQEIRRIENERRDAHDTLRIKQRGEHERIDEQSEERLRKALTDEGYQRYIEWKTTRLGSAIGAPRAVQRDPSAHAGPRGRGNKMRAPEVPDAPEAPEAPDAKP